MNNQELYTVNDISKILNLSKRRTQELIKKYVESADTEDFRSPFPHKDEKGAWVLSKKHLNALMIRH